MTSKINKVKTDFMSTFRLCHEWTDRWLENDDWQGSRRGTGNQSASLNVLAIKFYAILISDIN